MDRGDARPAYRDPRPADEHAGSDGDAGATNAYARAADSDTRAADGYAGSTDPDPDSANGDAHPAQSDAGADARTSDQYSDVPYPARHWYS